MLKRYLPVLTLLIMVACSKDKLETIPSIKIKRISSSEVVPGQTLQIFLEYSDKEGDLSKGELTYVRDRTNIRPIENPAANDKTDTARYTLPEFPKATTGEIQVNIPYDFLTEDPNDNDTMILRLMVIDTKGNKSDTIATSPIVARQL